MVESFGRYIAVIMAITLLCVIPMQQGNIKLRRITKAYVTELVREFVETSAHQGEITLQEWERLHKKLQEGKCRFFLDISVGKRKDSGYREASWKNISYYQMTYHEEIKERLLKEGNYTLQTGDILMLEIREAKAERYECIWKSV